MEIATVYVLTLALFAGIPYVLDICLAYLSSYLSTQKTLNLLIEKATTDKLDLEELKEFMKEVGKPPTGIPGLARAMMALSVIVLLGIAAFHLIVNKTTDNDNLVVNNILSMLSGLLAAVTGFYFGGKKSEEKKPDQGNS